MPGYSGGTAASDITRFRGMIAESGTATYSDSALRTIIAGYPLPDIAGEWPYLTSGSVNTDWVSTYDLAAAASEVWTEKANAVSDNFDFTADGATYHKEQQYKHRLSQARYYAARRAPGSHTAQVYPTEPATQVWIGNLAEDDD